MPLSVIRCLSRSALKTLIDLGFESEQLDYKQSINLADKKACLELARDVMAMANTKGGFIVVGVEDEEFRPVGLDEDGFACLRESKNINDKLERHLHNHITVHSAAHRIDLPDGRQGVPFAVLFIPPLKEFFLAPQDGNYQDAQGRTRQLFEQGDIIIRNADSSTRIKSTSQLKREAKNIEEAYEDLISMLEENSPKDTPDSSDDSFFNPYNIAVIAQEDMFKGREDETKRLTSLVASGSHVCIYGLQRVGKTSFVEHTLKEKGNSHPHLKNMVLATVNLQELGSENVTQKQLIDKIVTSIATALTPDGNEQSIQNAFNQYLDQAQNSVGDGTKLFRVFQSALEAILGKSPKRVVLFLDEFSELCCAIENNEKLAQRPTYRRDKLAPGEMYIDIPFMKCFSNLMKSPELHRKLTVVFAARPFVAEYDGEKNMQVFKLTQSIALYYLTESASKSLIKDPIKNHLKISDETADYLYRQTAGHPYLIQHIMQELVDEAIISGRSTITLEEVKGIEQKLVTAGAPSVPLFHILDSDYSVDEIKTPETKDLGRGTLALLSRLGTEKPEGWVEEREIKKTLARYNILERPASNILSRLKNAEIIKEMRAENILFIRVAVPLLRKRYVAQNYFLQYFPQSTKR